MCEVNTVKLPPAITAKSRPRTPYGFDYEHFNSVAEVHYCYRKMVTSSGLFRKPVGCLSWFSLNKFTLYKLMPSLYL